ncbi:MULTISPECIES: type II toxin-antitoxin system PemK/MazF family toxin [unclassified Chamaesiphon]|uniref:type II toxin-antitoxin system PemK/MazF family toxin n=1 Tax=unclassified Chamaesiphon TaxID=2620921 RepID=UPI00286CE356|nr:MULTISPECIES: type II toxin-antitoxin system PemK/MazF family toxin [unclassified Chamaesiphon]
MTSLSIDVLPLRSDIWLVNLNPTIGSEIRKTRPVVVISVDSTTLGVRLRVRQITT